MIAGLVLWHLNGWKVGIARGEGGKVVRRGELM